MPAMPRSRADRTVTTDLPVESVRRQLRALAPSAPDVEGLVEIAVQAWERAQAARALIAEEGLVIEVRQGRVPHPALRAERDAYATYLAAARILRAPAARRVKPASRPTRTAALLRDSRLGAFSGKAQKYLG
jgi:phage terminase small subunit